MTPWSFKMSHCLWNYLTVKCWCFWESKVFLTSASFELSVTHFDIFGEKFQPTFAFVFCKIIYIWNILILKEHQALVSLVCMFDCNVPKNSEARINITRPKILLKHDLWFERFLWKLERYTERNLKISNFGDQGRSSAFSSFKPPTRECCWYALINLHRYKSRDLLGVK